MPFIAKTNEQLEAMTEAGVAAYLTLIEGLFTATRTRDLARHGPRGRPSALWRALCKAINDVKTHIVIRALEESLIAQRLAGADECSASGVLPNGEPITLSLDGGPAYQAAKAAAAAGCDEDPC
jgi:hypothetical protein